MTLRDPLDDFGDPLTWLKPAGSFYHFPNWNDFTEHLNPQYIYIYVYIYNCITYIYIYIYIYIYVYIYMYNIYMYIIYIIIYIMNICLGWAETTQTPHCWNDSEGVPHPLQLWSFAVVRFLHCLLRRPPSQCGPTYRGEHQPPHQLALWWRRRWEIYGWLVGLSRTRKMWKSLNSWTWVVSLFFFG